MQMAAGDLDSAVRNLERAIALQPRNALVYKGLVEVYEKREDREKYEKSLDRALMLDRKDFSLMIKKLKLLTEQGRLEDADRLLQALQKVNPAHPDVMVQQARLALAHKRPGDAVPVYQLAVERFPHPDLVAELALAQWQDGQLEPGIKTLQEWLKEHPEDVVVRYNLANLYLAADRHEEAREAFSRVVEAQPNHPVALTNLALLSRQSDPDKAFAYARAAHMLAPGTPVTQDILAQILLDRGEVGQALGLLEQAVAAAPQDLQIRYHRAQALARSGETARAREELEKIVGTGKRFAGEREARALLDTLSHGSE
jgi:putative PEP-CTERM system TPR-repeat lipoprotein